MDGVENPLNTQTNFLSFQPDFFYIEDLEVELNHMILSLLGSSTCFRFPIGIKLISKEG